MSDVAREAGVSVKTVSNVVNNYIHVSNRTRVRVDEAIQKLGYQINVTAQSLRTGRSNSIGLAVPTLANPYFAELAQAVTREAHTHGLTVLMELTDGDREKERAVLSGPLRTVTDGLMLSTVAMPQEDLSPMDVGFPLVVLGDQLFHGAVSQVTMANFDGAKAATEYLIDRGATRIALLGKHPLNPSTAVLRQQGYEKALVDRGISLHEELLWPTDEWYRDFGFSAVGAAISDGAKFDGIFALNDALALGALHALSSEGLGVPEDVQVIGFDNLSEAAYSSPPLTTVDPGVHAIARDAVNLLVSKIADPLLIDCHEMIVEPFAIIDRSSTAARILQQWDQDA